MSADIDRVFFLRSYTSEPNKEKIAYYGYPFLREVRRRVLPCAQRKASGIQHASIR